MGKKILKQELKLMTGKNQGGVEDSRPASKQDNRRRKSPVKTLEIRPEYKKPFTEIEINCKVCNSFLPRISGNVRE